MPPPFSFPWRSRDRRNAHGSGGGQAAHDTRSVPDNAAHDCIAVQPTNGDRADVGDGSDDREECRGQCNALGPGSLEADNILAHSANDGCTTSRHHGIARADGAEGAVGSMSSAPSAHHDTVSKPVPHRFRTGAKPEPAPDPRQYATLSFVHNGVQRIMPGATQARQYLDWLKTDEEQVLLHHDMLASYNEFALEHQIEPVPWNALARHLNDLLLRPGQSRKPSVYRPLWPTTTRKRVRVYIIPPR